MVKLSSSDPMPVPVLPERLAAERQAEIAKVAKEFEAIFMEVVLNNMRKTVMKSEFIDGGHAEGIYRDMLDGEYAKIMGHGQNGGLSDQIVKQLTVADQQALKRGLQAYRQEGLNMAAKQVTMEVGQ